MPVICLIDDDIMVRDALALGLSDAGFEVLTAPGAAAGFDIANRRQVDAIVTDMNMPGTDGAQLIAEARRQWPDLPIVAISGATVIDGRAITDIARERGANAALSKPFRARQLAEVLERLIAERRGSPS
ncbi:response regulator [Vitreimonas flagellata]|uniref:response regulator n=1 Tax=Vitreimonas flagellata TaxID=2560861 RepID=UPI00107534D6|nr:response regulator [Vitreimonas flagellata]